MDNLSRFIEVAFALLINNIETRIRDTSQRKFGSIWMWRKVREILLRRADPQNNINNLVDEMHTFHGANDLIHVQTMWLQKVVLNVSLQKEFTKFDGLRHVFPKMEFT